MTSAIAARIDEIFSEWEGENSPGCAVGIYQHGEITYARGFGMANLEHAIPNTPASVFHVASISKQFTAHCLALLEREQRLSFDDDIRQYVPEIPAYGEPITIRQLMHHTSGLRDQWQLLELSGWRPDDVITDDDVLEICCLQNELNFPPGSRHLYSNTGYTLMAIIVKRITGTSLREFAHNRIFEPLGMTSTHFHDDHNEIVPGRTHGYEPRDDGGWRISNPIFDTTGATSLHTTVEDLFEWDRYLSGWLADPTNEVLLKPAVLLDGEETTYGCGLSYGVIGALETVGHSGSDAGYRAHYMRVPERDTAVAILCNASTMAPDKLAQQVLDVVLDLNLDESEASGAEEVTLSDEQLAVWCGVYRSPKTGMYQEIVLEDGQLQLPMLYDLKLTSLAPDRFRTEGPVNVMVTFEEGEGTPNRLILGEVDTLERIERVDLSAKRISDYAGSYTSDELATTYRIELEGDQFVWRRRRFADEPLRHLSNDTFVGGQTCFEFDRDSAGRVTGFQIRTMRASGMRFSKLSSQD